MHGLQHTTRDGNRGGQALFDWEDVRLMSYKDREQYLGSTVKLGYLDKGGKWRKKDWWIGQNADQESKVSLGGQLEFDQAKYQQELKKQRDQVRRKQNNLMMKKLGLKCDQDKYKPQKQKVNSYDLQDIAKEDDELDQIFRASRGKGMGFQKSLKAKIRSIKKAVGKQEKNINRLEAIGFDNQEDLNEKKLEQSEKNKRANKTEVNQEYYTQKKQRKLRKQLKREKKRRVKQQRKKHKRHTRHYSSDQD